MPLKSASETIMKHLVFIISAYIRLLLKATKKGGNPRICWISAIFMIMSHAGLEPATT